MIELTTLSGRKIWINEKLIRTIECVPDTLLCFVDGYRLTVQESPASIAGLIRKINQPFHVEPNAEVCSP